MNNDAIVSHFPHSHSFAWIFYTSQIENTYIKHIHYTCISNAVTRHSALLFDNVSNRVVDIWYNTSNVFIRNSDPAVSWFAWMNDAIMAKRLICWFGLNWFGAYVRNNSTKLELFKRNLTICDFCIILWIVNWVCVNVRISIRSFNTFIFVYFLLLKCVHLTVIHMSMYVRVDMEMIYEMISYGGTL